MAKKLMVFASGTKTGGGSGFANLYLDGSVLKTPLGYPFVPSAS